MTFSVSASITQQYRQTVQQVKQAIAAKTKQAVDRAARSAEAELKAKIREQTTLPTNLIDERVYITNKTDFSAQLVASGEPVPLEYFPHRYINNGVEVILSPGQVTYIEHARILGDGRIVQFDRRKAGQSSARRLYGVSPDQIARTAFANIAIGTRNELIEALS